MKPLSAMLIGVSLGLVLGALAAIRTPCPDLSVPPQSPAMQQREAQRDTLAIRRAMRKHLLDSIHSNPINREQSIRIARSLGRDAQLDTLLAEPR